MATSKKKEDREIVIREVTLALTANEVIDRAVELGSTLEQLTDLETKAKESSSGFRSQIKEMRAKIDKLGEVIRSKSETKEMDCYEIPDWKKGTMEVFRADTETRVHERAMTDDEKQMRI